MVVTDSNTKFVDKAGMDHAIDELKKYIDGISAGDKVYVTISAQKNSN